MKLVLQIAAGILLASALSTAAYFGVTVGIPAYAKHKAEQAKEEFLQQQAEKFDYDRDCVEGEAIADCIVRRVHEQVAENADQS